MVARIVDSASARVRVGRRNIPEDGGILEVMEGHAAYLAGRLTAKDFAAKPHEADVGDEGLKKTPAPSGGSVPPGEIRRTGKNFAKAEEDFFNAAGF